MLQPWTPWLSSSPALPGEGYVLVDGVEVDAILVVDVVVVAALPAAAPAVI